MHANDFFRSGRCGGDVSDGQGGRIGGEDAMIWNVLFHFLDDLVFDVDVFEDGFDDHVGFIESFVTDGAGDIGSDGVGFELRQLFSFHCNS